jgi:hypothetical protein
MSGISSTLAHSRPVACHVVIRRGEAGDEEGGARV